MISIASAQAKAVAAGLALAAAAAAGAMINGWRLDAAHALDLAAKDKHVAELQVAIEKQNASVAALGAERTAADDRRKVAERYAAGLIKSLDARAAAVAGSKAIDCDGVLREAWGGEK